MFSFGNGTHFEYCGTAQVTAKLPVSGDGANTVSPDPSMYRISAGFVCGGESNSPAWRIQLIPPWVIGMVWTCPLQNSCVEILSLNVMVSRGEAFMNVISALITEDPPPYTHTQSSLAFLPLKATMRTLWPWRGPSPNDAGTLISTSSLQNCRM